MLKRTRFKKDYDFINEDFFSKMHNNIDPFEYNLETSKENINDYVKGRSKEHSDRHLKKVSGE